MKFEEGPINDIIIKPLSVFTDQRGWLTELFRNDELPEGFQPAMGYVSVTHEGVVRGPHEHTWQTDYFCFLGQFSLYLWDNRKDSPTYLRKMIIEEARNRVIIVPPGVVHAYRNTADEDGLVLNFPDKLYAGRGKKEKVDETRYENDPESPFQVWGVK
ncbi:dTDP-4-dehydrorhamnose 3,5-epimerase [hydrothermal vent metagenome]|uniref:dTDP-4-dehydrorhamnose 3,5-epimerase n=1 Tax=hydrothermal vent metagenome TaxID=652676 RepID=A0A3B1CXX0_9ZZZZ